MNGCDDIRDWLSAYLDGELTSHRREAVEAHLAGCEACRQELASLCQVSACLQAWQAPKVRPELSAVFAERLAAKSRRPESRRWFAGAWPRAAWAAGLAACLAFGIFVCLQHQAPYRPPVQPAHSADAGSRRNVVAKRGPVSVPIKTTTGPTVAQPIRSVTTTTPVVIHHRPVRVSIPKGPAPVMEKGIDEAPVVDPVMTAVNALNETPVLDGAAVMLADSYIPGNNLELNGAMSKTGIAEELPPPVEANYENQPEALAIALITEAP